MKEGSSLTVTIIYQVFAHASPARLLTRELCDAARVMFRPGCSAQAFEADCGLRAGPGAAGKDRPERLPCYGSNSNASA